MRLIETVAHGQPLGVAARLLVGPDAPRSGLGRALLHHATNWSLAHDRLPVLDVVTTSLPAIELYRSEGWTDLGYMELNLRGLTGVHELVFVHPSLSSVKVARR